MLEKGLFLITLIGFCGVIVILTLANPENVFAFKPIGPTETLPIQPLEQPETTQESPLSMSVSSSPFLNYENSTFGIRISYPSNWTKYESQNGSSDLIVQFAEGAYNENNNYTKEISPGGLAIKGASFTLNSSNSYTSLWVQEQLNRFMDTLPSFKLVEMKSIILNSHQQNIPATMTSYSYRDSLNREVNAFIIDILKDGRAYSLEYSAEPQIYSKNLPILLEMINTFEVTQTPYTTMVIPPSSNFKTYENSTMDIKIDHPENWMYKEEKDIVTFDFNSGLFRIAVFPSDYSSSQEAADISTNNLMQSFSDFNLILSEPIKLGGANFTSSNMLVYTVNNDLGSTNKEMLINTVHAGKVYWILYGADLAVYPILEPTVQRMIDSFQITDTPDTTAAGSPTPTPTPAPTPLLLSSKYELDKTQDIMLKNGTSYPIKYKITGGKVSNMDLEHSSVGAPSLIIRINPEVSEDNYKGKLVIEIPNTVLGSHRNFIAYNDNSPTESKKLASNSNSAIVEAAFYNFEPGQETIEIVGAG